MWVALMYLFFPKFLRPPVTRTYLRSLQRTSSQLQFEDEEAGILYSAPFGAFVFIRGIDPMARFYLACPVIDHAHTICCLFLNGDELPNDCHLDSVFSQDVMQMNMSVTWPISTSSILHSASGWAWEALFSWDMVKGRRVLDASDL